MKVTITLKWSSKTNNSIPGVYIVQNTMAREEGGNGAGEKNEKWGSGEQNEKEGKREKEKGERKKKKRKRGSVIFLLI